MYEKASRTVPCIDCKKSSLWKFIQKTHFNTFPNSLVKVCFVCHHISNYEKTYFPLTQNWPEWPELDVWSLVRSFSPECQDHFIPLRVIFCRPASVGRVTSIFILEADEIASFSRVNHVFWVTRVINAHLDPDCKFNSLLNAHIRKFDYKKHRDH